MADTKERILDSSLKLFNKYGLAEVSQRRISDRMMISPGNLTYHFKKKEDISQALYFRLVEKIDELHGNLNKGPLTLTVMGDFSKALFKLFFEYRFIFLDFVQLMKNNKEIATHYQQLLIQRKHQFLHLAELLITQDILLPEEIVNEHDHIYTRTQILTDFYLSSVEITTNGVTEDHINQYLELLMSSFYPYLTAKGKMEYLENYGNQKLN